MENGSEIQDYLQTKSGQRTVPNIFISECSVSIQQDIAEHSADQKHVGGDELVALQTYDVANHDVLPFLVCEGAVGLENLCEARVELGIGLVSFLLRE